MCAWLCARRLPNASSPCRDAHSVAMSSRDLLRVVALSCKSLELQKKVHYARALEKGAAAIAAAQELAQEDCLVVTHLQLKHISSLQGYVKTPGVSPEAASAAKEQAGQMLLAAMATLERRKATGTLLAGMCRSWPEEEWYGLLLQRRRVWNGNSLRSPEELADLVQFVGYDAYLDVAASVVFSFDSEPSPDHALWRFAVRAIDLFEQPRPKIWVSSSQTLASESVLTCTMQKFSETCSSCLKKNGPHALPGPVAETFARWQRFARSGVLQERHVFADFARIYTHTSAASAATQARLAAATLRCCSLRSCGARELHPSHYKQCGACKTVAYCCREHQLEDWPAHKAACKAARKAAVEEAGGAA